MSCSISQPPLQSMPVDGWSAPHPPHTHTFLCVRVACTWLRFSDCVDNVAIGYGWQIKSGLFCFVVVTLCDALSLRVWKLWHLNDSNINNFALHGGRALDGFGTFLTPLRVISYISLNKEKKRTCIAPIVSKTYNSTTNRSDVDHTELPANTQHLPFLRIRIR